MHLQFELLSDGRVLAELEPGCRDAVQTVVQSQAEISGLSLGKWQGQVLDTDDLDEQSSPLSIVVVVIVVVVAAFGGRSQARSAGFADAGESGRGDAFSARQRRRRARGWPAARPTE